MIESLRSLSCFEHIETIVPISAGLSSQCYQVNADKKTFFAKQVANSNEALISLLAAEQNISPTVVYHDKHWLITEYIVGESLALSQTPIHEQASIAITLMVQCHLIPPKATELVPTTVSQALINQAHCSSIQKAELSALAKQLTAQLSNTEHKVCCHGDLNFSNILISQKSNPWLLDFECACTAPAEFDLAMFIAINNIADEKIAMIINQYQRLLPAVNIKMGLFNHYLAFAYFINSLWYFNAHQNRKSEPLKGLFTQQWHKFIATSKNEHAKSLLIS
ncbi:MAG: phosphotransferase [Colwellia sp.]|nr:phosphotransferase [Colwellia sp.]MCW8865512.1 phosphotransferase [Colwellia sp.]MCW9080967.1 phosphotransferase [Colwellia sp.]